MACAWLRRSPRVRSSRALRVKRTVSAVTPLPDEICRVGQVIMHRLEQEVGIANQGIASFRSGRRDTRSAKSRERLSGVPTIAAKARSARPSAA